MPKILCKYVYIHIDKITIKSRAGTSFATLPISWFYSFILSLAYNCNFFFRWKKNVFFFNRDYEISSEALASSKPALFKSIHCCNTLKKKLFQPFLSYILVIGFSKSQQ